MASSRGRTQGGVDDAYPPPDDQFADPGVPRYHSDPLVAPLPERWRVVADEGGGRSVRLRLRRHTSPSSTAPAARRGPTSRSPCRGTGPPEPSENRFNELALRLLTDRERGKPSDPAALRVEFPKLANLIASLVRADSGLDELLLRLSLARPAIPTLIGQRIEDIELVAFLDSGGQGEVYVGWQTVEKR